MVDTDAGRKPADEKRRSQQVAWLRQVAAGGRAGTEALRQLHEAYDARVVRYGMWRYSLARADVEEIWQDVLVKIHTHAAEFRPDTDPETWIWALVRNRAIDEIRKPAHRMYRDPGPDGAPEPAVPPSQGRTSRLDTDDCVHRGLQKFGREHVDEAMAVSLRDLSGWGIPQLAAYLGRTETATRSFLTALRKKLRPFMEPCLELLSNEA